MSEPNGVCPVCKEQKELTYTTGSAAAINRKRICGDCANGDPRKFVEPNWIEVGTGNTAVSLGFLFLLVAAMIAVVALVGMWRSM